MTNETPLDVASYYRSRAAIPGFDPDTDRVETNADFLTQVTMARVRRGVMKAYMPLAALLDPWPEEFLWRPLKALGVVDVWWSLLRAPHMSGAMLESVYLTADQWRFAQMIPRELVADAVAWKAFQRHQFTSFLMGYQDVLDEREAQASELSAAE